MMMMIIAVVIVVDLYYLLSGKNVLLKYRFLLNLLDKPQRLAIP
jgi:hypothetical protein